MERELFVYAVEVVSVITPESPSRSVTAEVTQVAQAKVRSLARFPPPVKGDVVLIFLPMPTIPNVVVDCQAIPKELVEEAAKRNPFVPTVNPFQPVELAAMILPVVVAIPAKSFH